MKTYKTEDATLEIVGKGKGYQVKGALDGMPVIGEAVEIDGRTIVVTGVDAMWFLTYPPRRSDRMIIYGYPLPNSNE